MNPNDISVAHDWIGFESRRFAGRWNREVVDCHANYPGFELSPDVELTNPTMSWTDNRAARPTIVTITCA